MMTFWATVGKHNTSVKTTVVPFGATFGKLGLLFIS